MWRAVCDQMNLNVTDYLSHPGKKFPVNVQLDAEAAPSLPKEVRFLEEIAVIGEAFAQLNLLYLDIQIHTTIEQPCCRCLAPVHSQVDLNEVFETTIPTEEATIDLLPQILGFILASLDPHPLCRPDCPGLCPVCGVDLNQHPDHTCCDMDEEPPRLRDFL